MATARRSFTTARLIQLAYPAPCPIESSLEDQESGDGAAPLYCVGGAVYLYVQGIPAEAAARDERYPPVARIAEALRRLNPSLSPSAARGYALAVTQSNDMPSLGGPQRAWRHVDEALKPSSRRLPGLVGRRFRGFKAMRLSPPASRRRGPCAGGHSAG